MQISLQQVFPTFFENGKAAGSQLWNQSLSFNKGENIHIIAPSGSGKTSFIHFLYGLRNDYTGKILYDTRLSTFDIVPMLYAQINIILLRVFTGRGG